ncbi:EAL domain-containing protein [Listeria fleischmannii 1991]|uniref:Uncharacterized membrane protein YjcC n=2 Tax=Listeria fleischmannii TaxID=1069827 RepID=A0A2X3HBW2_9LIST|nr:EAL domain-containing protein [Listeria fleischmannii]EMG29139.1 EAL domain-containing protein [Listeria fleischmannii subsp. fleischmannii LU2006-1]KMT61297.1 EAL domain-containing protein [Listeria fleischmannii 1991]SQC69791.1 Uncharacterized membrane protein YjcC [Listeria fleischmannii subsp. fleischmannii]
MNKKQILKMIETNAFQTIYQPIVNIQENQIYGYESLTRISSEPISEFIQSCEENRLTSQFELRTIKNGMNHFSWRESTRLFLNISYGTFLKYYDEIEEWLKDSGKITFEFLETSYVEENQRFDLYAKMAALTRQFDTQFAIDDYGSGYADIARVLRQPTDFVKTDAQLIKDFKQHQGKKLVLTNLHRFLEKNQKKMVVEGVENKEQLEFLQHLGVTYAQGFYFTKGMKN